MAGKLAACALLLATAAFAAPRDPAPVFQTSDRCLACHNGIQTSAGEDVSIGFNWRPTMMANSARDPYWQAAVRREITDHPAAAARIEDECAKCHMPMARHAANREGRAGQVFAHLPFDAKPAPGLAADGVSCSICHQIGPDKLGTPESFTGGFVIDPPDAQGHRAEYGPYKIEAGQASVMRSSTGGFRPTESEHIRRSELCATCHTLFTHAIGPDGKPAGTFPEQVPYQEWLHSSFRETKSCQSCHMPVVKEEVPFSKVLGTPREGVARHVFLGGNFFMLQMLARYRGELGVTALPEELADAAARTVAFLQKETARVAVANAALRAGRLEFEVAVENLSGHKFPTAYPSRRAWLRVSVRNAAGAAVFESGAFRPDGSIAGNDNDADPARYEPHYTEIKSPDQVQIYESVMGDLAGQPTTGLLKAVQYLKDNRLLPAGFDKRSASADIAPVGAAAGDEDFRGAGDRVRYSVALPSATGPFRIEAELWFQPISHRWAANLRPYGAVETRNFTAWYEAMAPSSAIVVAKTSLAARPE